MGELLAIISIGLIAIGYIVWHYFDRRKLIKDDELTSIEKIMAEKLNKRK
jgi:hypothetical protein